MSNRRRLFCYSMVVASLCAGSIVMASNGRFVDVSERIKGANRVVVARTTGVTASWRENAHGDRLIVSQLVLHVEETLKGGGQADELMELEGGTLDGFTLRVSDLPEVALGDRAVFFLDRTNSPVSVPHLRGLGI